MSKRKRGEERSAQIKADARFNHIRSDPRFKPIKSETKKTKLDSRFSQIFDDKFNTAGMIIIVYSLRIIVQIHFMFEVMSSDNDFCRLIENIHKRKFFPVFPKLT